MLSVEFLMLNESSKAAHKATNKSTEHISLVLFLCRHPVASQDLALNAKNEIPRRAQYDG
ncbi:hypothetical protein CBP31_12080 [Oceanisphaera profunda]|uniref:Uncharacterized protein n=1 Tax=Oceanisphaera profunda TaxID=1416627 RepID=A0A1Y0D6V1_9GAMM|nr:hypothetical protein CBP31_12080 [Oceanisphaera profunda]